MNQLTEGQTFDEKPLQTSASTHSSTFNVPKYIHLNTKVDYI